MNVIKQRNVLSYLVTASFMTMAFSLPHTVLTVLLLKKGISIPQIMIIQAGYSLAIVLSEFPSGVMADLWSRKTLYISSKLFLCMMFLIVLLSNNFYMLCLAWILYGLSAALDSGTIDSQIISEIKLKKQNLIDKFISIDNKVQTTSMIFGSMLGGVLYYKIGLNIYILGLSFVLIGTFVCYKYYNVVETKKFVRVKSRINAQVIGSFKEMLANKYLKEIIFLSLTSQLFFQTHYQLWQAYLLSKQMNSKLFTIYYLIFQIITIVSYSVPLNKIGKLGNFKLGYLVILVLPFFLLSKNYLIYSTAYIVYVLIFFIIEYMVEYLFNKEVSLQHISSLVSLKSTFSRLSSILVLLLISLSLKFFKVEEVIIFNFVLSFALVAYIIIKYNRILKV